MDKKVLVVVDMQRDFIDGSLGTKEAVAIVDEVADYIAHFDGEVVFTRDTHHDDYIKTQEGQRLPVPHCIEGTKGWQLHESLEGFILPDTKIFNKPTFGSLELAQYLRGKKGLSEITLIGLCTDICVISNSMIIKAYMPEVSITVVEKCCAGVTPESHKHALEIMELCQIAVK